ncbi:hypothetical protein BJV82DRAFT_264964 [Fennellomyces sp. T-0311]|nr:hypothetical protein BJV82DRAFT_264964 [Fennellomyces sp. T-0311]
MLSFGARNELKKVGTKVKKYSNGSDAIHSRTGSDNSTSRLAQQRGSGGYDAYDPYAVPPQQPTEKKKKHRRTHESQEYPAYLPYSQHEHAEAFAAPEPVYTQPAVSVPSYTKKRRCCGIARRTIVFAAFIFVIIVAVVWFFVWPRFPDALAFQEVNIPEGTNSVHEELIIKTVWNTSFTLDNSDNWIPTRMQGFDVRAVDMDTRREIGKGSTGSIMLPGRQSMARFNVRVRIDYSSSKKDDTTLNNLKACMTPQQIPGSTNEVTESLNVAFFVKMKISGIVWSQEASARPSAFRCPQQ